MSSGNSKNSVYVKTFADSRSASLTRGYEKKGFKGGNNDFGGGRSNKQITCPCGTKFVPRMPNQFFCSFAYKKISRKTDGSDLDRTSQLLGSHKAGQQLLDKASAKNKKKWGKKKAGAHHASANINFHDLSSASDASFCDEQSETAATAAIHIKRGKDHGKRKRSKRKFRNASAISRMCQGMHWFPKLLARLVLKGRNLLK